MNRAPAMVLMLLLAAVGAAAAAEVTAIRFGQLVTGRGDRDPGRERPGDEGAAGGAALG